MIHLSLRSLIQGSIISLTLSAQVPSRTAVVEIVAHTLAGDAVTSGEVDLVEVRSKRSWRRNFQGLRGAGIPYGEFVLRVSVLGFRLLEGRLWVYQPHVYARVLLSVSRIVDETPRTIRGRVRLQPEPKRPLWARLLPLRTNGSPPMDFLLTDDGWFEFSGMVLDEYLLMIMSEDQTLFTGRVQPSAEAVMVDLQRPKP